MYFVWDDQQNSPHLVLPHPKWMVLQGAAGQWVYETHARQEEGGHR